MPGKLRMVLNTRRLWTQIKSCLLVFVAIIKHTSRKMKKKGINKLKCGEKSATHMMTSDTQNECDSLIYHLGTFICKLIAIISARGKMTVDNDGDLSSNVGRAHIETQWKQLVLSLFFSATRLCVSIDGQCSSCSLPLFLFETFEIVFRSAFSFVLSWYFEKCSLHEYGNDLRHTTMSRLNDLSMSLSSSVCLLSATLS